MVGWLHKGGRCLGLSLHVFEWALVDWFVHDELLPARALMRACLFLWGDGM